ncbi:MAG: hypothetical protein MJZ55_04940 [Paludibacteraceae bacterium]|nr:hypothetical protein [Paludibacteraceae bacterium]
MLTFTDELFEQFARQHASELLHGQSDVKLWRQIVAKAVFMTASEIHAKLKMWGNITTPMPLNKFGELLKRRGYPPRKLHSGKRGYVVKVTENLTDKQYQEIHELFSAAGAASTF